MSATPSAARLAIFSLDQLLTALNNHKMGRYAEAEPNYQRALELMRAVLGEKHPDCAAILNNLGVLYYCLNRFAEAELLLSKALDIYRGALGEHHPSYLDTLRNLVAVCRIGRLVEFREQA